MIADGGPALPDSASAVDAGLLPLSALLSQALIAFIIETDNEAEHRMPHRTTDQGATGPDGGPWLASLAMYENCMRYAGDSEGEPLTVGELKRLARTETNLDGMRRWGYVTYGMPRTRSASTGRLIKPGPNTIIKATAAGQRAREVWAPLPALIEDRWRERYGPAAVNELRAALQAVVRHLDASLPDTLPILGYGLFCRRADPLPPPSAQPVTALSLNALLSRMLLSIALEFERESTLSIAISANLLRVLTTESARLRDLPRLTGVSKESISMAFNMLRPARLAVTESEPGGRGQIARLTPAGADAKHVQREHLGACEARVEHEYPDAFRAIRRVLEPLAGSADGAPPPLFAALAPYPDGWRAAVRPPAVLPHFPMVLHRGGYPDGS